VKHFHSLFLAASLFLVFSSEGFAKNCQEVRMGFDIGSGSTKMMVAKVDFCQNKVLETLYNENRAVSYNEDLEKNADGKLSPFVIDQGLRALKEMMEAGKKFKPKKTYGVATSVFRKAQNGSDVIKTFARKLNIKLEVIPQETEAMLAYLSVLSLVDESAVGTKNIVVWDIGGGSMQMFTLDDKKKPVTYLGDLASVTFKNMLIEVLELKNIETTNSPNPIGEKREQAIALARSYARLHVSTELKNLLKDKIVIGVGGVHGQSIKNQLALKEMKYTVEDLARVGKVQAQKSDKELQGDYKSTDVSNIFLIEGFMEALGIKEVKVMSINLIHGVLLRS
jgi:exopolyphosphatase/guanosine-5'-triphosphate,3'-diphosphate pyrophosphatase